MDPISHPLQAPSLAPEFPEQALHQGDLLRELPPVLVLDEVLSVLRISRRVWFRRKRAKAPIVPEIPGLPHRYSREAVLRVVRFGVAHGPTVKRRVA